MCVSVLILEEFLVTWMEISKKFVVVLLSFLYVVRVLFVFLVDIAIYVVSIFI